MQLSKYKGAALDPALVRLGRFRGQWPSVNWVLGFYPSSPLPTSPENDTE